MGKVFSSILHGNETSSKSATAVKLADILKLKNSVKKCPRTRLISVMNGLDNKI